MYDIVKEEIESVNGLAALDMNTVTAIANLANQTANSVATVTNSFANLKAAKTATTGSTVNPTTSAPPKWVTNTREMIEKQINAGGGTVVGENGANPYTNGGSLYNGNNNNQKKETDWTPFLIGGAIGLGLLLVFMMNNKKK